MVEGFLSTSVIDEQAAVGRLKAFLVDVVGWVVAEDVTDTASDRDIVFQSEGESGSGNTYTRYIRLRGTSDGIALYTYETFTDVSTNTGEVNDATYGLLNTEADTQGFFLIAVADLERVVLHVETYNGVRYMAYAGRINSYYTVAQHNYPNLVKGCQAVAYDWYYSAEERNCWMVGPEGAQKHYFAIEPLAGTNIDTVQVSDRNGKLSLAAPVLVHDGDAGNSELVGEPRGVFRVPDIVSSHNMFLSINNRLYVVLESNDIKWAVGPISELGTVVPRLQTDLTS